MKRRSLILTIVLVLTATVSMASQFVVVPFEQMARQSTFIARGTLGPVWSQWDDAGEVIFSYSTLRVSKYFGETTGPDTLVIREVGGKVGNYTQEAVGFPVLREGQEVVLFLTQCEDSADYRIDSYNQGKFLVRHRGEQEILTLDKETQGHERQHKGPQMQTDSVDDNGFTMEEFTQMVDDARAGFDRAPATRE